MLKRTLVTLAIIFAVSFSRVFYIMLLTSSDESDAQVRRLRHPEVDRPRCQFDVTDSEFALRGPRLQRDLKRGTSTCRDLRRPQPESVRTNGRWQIQDTGDDKLVLYSAFYDDRPAVGIAPWIRIIGVAKLANTTHHCHVWYDGCDTPYVTTAVVNVTGRDFGYVIEKVRYVQYLLSCRLAGTEPVPSHVSIVAERCSTSTVYLAVERPVRAEPDIEFGVCVAIAFGNIPAPVFVEWIELTWMLGVREFNVYDAGMVNMSQVFNHYTRRGWLKVHHMPPPVTDLSKSKVVYMNGTNSTVQISEPSLASVKLASPASLNDCMMRNVYRYRYAVVIDFDEIIIPRFHDDYEQMVAHIDRKYRLKDRAYTYTFSNTYFFLAFQQDTTQPAYLRTMRLRKRVPPTGMASKSFVDPRWCLSGFNHYCLRPLRPPSTTLVHIHVNPDIARSHHYRNCGFGNKTCSEYFAQQTTDDVSLRFKRRLQPAVEDSLHQLGMST